MGDNNTAVKPMEDTTLQRTFGMKEAVTITVGNVIGVGLFTTGAQIVGTMGSSVILATFIAMVISVYPAKLYGEMGAALPFAGGTYKYAQLGLGKPAGVLAGWNFIASLIAVTSGEALAFAFYFKTLFRAFGIELPISDMLLASIPIILFIITNIRGTEMTGRLQNGFMVEDSHRLIENFSFLQTLQYYPSLKSTACRHHIKILLRNL